MVLTNDRDAPGVRPEPHQPKPAPQNHHGPAQSFFSMFDALLGQAHEVPQLRIEPFKMLVYALPFMEMECQHEEDLQRVYRASTKILYNCLRPYFLRDSLPSSMTANIPLISKAQREMFENISARMSACGLIKITIATKNTGDLVTCSINAGYAIYDEKKNQDILSSNKTDLAIKEEANLAQVPITDLALGLDVVRDDIFGKVNCQSFNVLNDIMGLLFELGLVSIHDAIIIDRREVKSEDIHADMAKHKLVAGNLMIGGFEPPKRVMPNGAVEEVAH